MEINCNLHNPSSIELEFPIAASNWMPRINLSRLELGHCLMDTLLNRICKFFKSLEHFIWGSCQHLFGAFYFVFMFCTFIIWLTKRCIFCVLHYANGVNSQCFCVFTRVLSRYQWQWICLCLPRQLQIDVSEWHWPDSLSLLTLLQTKRAMRRGELNGYASLVEL